MTETNPEPFTGLIRVFQGRNGTLLLAIIALLVFMPTITLGPSWGLLLSILMSGVLIASLHAARRGRRSFVIGIGLAVVALVIRGLSVWEPAGWLIHLYYAVVGAILVFTVLSLMSTAMHRGGTKLQRIQAALCVYLLLGMVWCQIYAMIGLVVPGAFHFPREAIVSGPDLMRERHRFVQLVYFSYATLTTVGYGDITPAQGVAQMFACLEAIAGQVYLTVLIANLVSLRGEEAPGDPGPG